MCGESGGIWEETVIAYCKVLTQHLFGGTEEKP